MALYQTPFTQYIGNICCFFLLGISLLVKNRGHNWADLGGPVDIGLSWVCVFPEESPNAFFGVAQRAPKDLHVHCSASVDICCTFPHSTVFVCIRIKNQRRNRKFVRIRGSFPQYVLPKSPLLAKLKLVRPSLYNWWGASNLCNVFISFIQLKSTWLQWFQLYLQRYLFYICNYLTNCAVLENRQCPFSIGITLRKMYYFTRRSYIRITIVGKDLIYLDLPARSCSCYGVGTKKQL